jgi:hypothetical protein
VDAATTTAAEVVAQVRAQTAPLDIGDAASGYGLYVPGEGRLRGGWLTNDDPLAVHLDDACTVRGAAMSPLACMCAHKAALLAHADGCA